MESYPALKASDQQYLGFSFFDMSEIKDRDYNLKKSLESLKIALPLTKNVTDCEKIKNYITKIEDMLDL